MSCMKCRLRKWYYTLLKWLMLPTRTAKDGIKYTSQVVATLYKDGKILKQIVGRPHNKWQTTGLEVVRDIICHGGSGTDPGEVHTMVLGTQCSDTGWSGIVGSDESTPPNSPIGSTQVKFTAEWVAAGAIADICQAAIKMYGYTGSGTTVFAAIYNFVTAFTKPDGVSLKIEWTTTLSPA